MTVAISLAHNVARLEGTATFLNDGAGRPKVKIYSGTRPADTTVAPSTAMLVEIEFSKPVGPVAGGALPLVEHQDGLIMETGVAGWARVFNGDGAVAFDCDVGEGPGAWEVQLLQTQLYAGGSAKIVSASLG